MKLLVTGSSGFIGRHVVRQLEERGHEVAGLDRRDPPDAGGRHFAGDLLDAARVREVMEEVRPEVVIHLAAKTSLKEVAPDSPHFHANTVGTGNLMEAMAAAGSVRRALYVSTKYVFRGPPPAGLRQYRPTTSYGRSKAEMEERIWDADGAVPEWCILRPTTIWGPGMGPHYQRFLQLVRRGRYVHFGSGGALKHLGYVENTAWQIVRLAEAPAEAVHAKVLYVGDYDAIRVGDWAEGFRRAFDAPPIRSVPMPVAGGLALLGDLLVRCGWRKFPLTRFRFRNLTEDDLCDMEPTREVCGEAPVGLGEAARRTADWIRTLD